jgi:transposase-like protein
MNLRNPIYTNEDKARKHLEALRWPNGAICPHCGVIGNAVELEGKSTRPGVYKCRDCRKPFSVTVGTVFERSHIPLSKWLLAVHLMSSSKKGISSHQLHRMLGVTYKTAWFMSHRIREAMRTPPSPIGGEGKVVEADETFVGGIEKNKHKNKRTPRSHGSSNKAVVFSVLERGGSVRSIHTGKADSHHVRPILTALVHERTVLCTDEAQHFKAVGSHFADHKVVKHALGQYVFGEVHTNTIEGFFSVFKKGMKGVYQHCGKQHLQRYLYEFDFRYNNRIGLEISDTERTERALQGIAGKRLTYRRIDRQVA